MAEKGETPEETPKDVNSWVRYILTGIGAAAFAALGGLWVSYADFRKDRQEANSASTEQTIEASDKLKPIIDKYSKIALGKAEQSSKENEILRDALRSALEKAEDTKNRWSGLERVMHLSSVFVLA